MLLLDTNVLSEMRKAKPRRFPAVDSWFRTQRIEHLYLSVITIQEVEYGIALLERRDRVQAARIAAWLADDVMDGFRGRILPIGLGEVRRAARLHVPDPRPERDAHIAATALVHGLTVVTRNSADFESTGVALLNPWALR